MGCRILETEDGRAILYDSVTETALQCPIFNSVEHAEDFCKWFDPDPRSVTYKELDTAHSVWLNERCVEGGDLKGDEDELPYTEPEDFDDEK